MLISSFLVQSFLNSMKSVKVLVLSSFSLSFTEPVITCHMSTVSRVTPPPRPSTWAYMSRLQGYPLPDLVPRVTCPQSPGCHPTPDPLSLSHGHTPPRHCTWILMSAISRVTRKTIYMAPHVHSLQGQPLPRHCTLGHKSIVPRVTPPFQNLYLGYEYTVSRETTPPRPCTWGYTSKIFRVSHIPGHGLGVIRPGSRVNPSPNPVPVVTHPHSLR